MFLFLIFLSLLFPKLSLANDNYALKETINYQVDHRGQATVNHQIQITNLKAETYLQGYELNISGYQIDKLSATDGTNNILDQFKSENDHHQIKLKLSHPKVGLNQQNNLTLNYHIKDFAKHKGKTWEIVIPQISDNLSSEVNISTPDNFGPLSFASIPVVFKNEPPDNLISFTRHPGKSNLIILGNYQLFDFNLRYFLKNNHSSPATAEIAIIPDTHSQAVFYRQIDPPPQNIHPDADGNWLATYQLKAGQELSITASGQVKTGLNLGSSLPNPENYLLDQTFWPVSDPKFTTISQDFPGPKSIYDFVVKTLDYNYDRFNSSVGRLGALAAIDDPKNALCTEFTDLFITIARQQKIPAREIQGFAYTNNPKMKPVGNEGDILHAWPEYYDFQKQQWLAIDPTWEKTTGGIDYFNKLDLNHITFVTHGLNSQQPLPPGAYPHPDGSQSINITFAKEELISQQPLPQVSLAKNQLILENPTPNAIKGLYISIPNLNYTHDADTILPYSTVSLALPKINFLTTLSPNYQKIGVILKNSENRQSQTSLFYLPHFINLGTLIILSLIILTLGGIMITSKKYEKNS